MAGFLILLAVVGFVAGGVASVTGFGIGSLLTPVFAARAGTKLAVAAVSIPHLAGTTLRFWRLRRRVDGHVLRGFGLTSAVGGGVGALLHNLAASLLLRDIFGALLIFAGLIEFTGLMRRLHLSGIGAYFAGALSGFFGGLVGNQGGIRSAAMLALDLQKSAFVATATAIALFVDGARMPVYFWTQHGAIAHISSWVALATVGVLAGTLAGERLLDVLRELWFRRFLAALLIGLGIAMLLLGN
jgi:uncharacterized membrane protein YfcA